MTAIPSHSFQRLLAVVVASVLFVGCADRMPVAPDRQHVSPTSFAQDRAVETDGAIATLRRVTARYHNLNAAIDDGFVLLHPCESRPGEGPVGIVYFHPGRLLDGVVDPALPDALIYEPHGRNQPKLVGVEFAVVDGGQAPPAFLGVTFQSEEEFGVFALHAWVWRSNPDGMFAETNPRVSCGAE